VAILLNLVKFVNSLVHDSSNLITC